MSDPNKPVVISNPWQSLQQFTDARIGLGRAGVSLPTAKHLEFQLAHARARDAVHCALDVDRLIDDLQSRAILDHLGDPIRVNSRARDRTSYLQRPDLGRLLDEPSRREIQRAAQAQPTTDLALVIADGLSPIGIQQHAAPFLRALLTALEESSAIGQFRLAPLTIAKQGRVAIGDQIGEGLQARLVVVLIGERPGLSSPDSLGAYLTYAPATGKNDSQRNCISNIRPRGLSFEEASRRLTYLLGEAVRLATSGVELKDRSGHPQKT